MGGGGAGDIYLRVRYAQHHDWQVRGSDLVGSLELAPWEAVLGATVSVPTLEGSISLKVPAGTKQGQQLRVRGKGLPAEAGRRGDLMSWSPSKFLPGLARKRNGCGNSCRPNPRLIRGRPPEVRFVAGLVIRALNWRRNGAHMFYRRDNANPRSLFCL
jgi:hypothetical protein